VVIGAPLHGRADHLAGALDSLLGQSHRDLAVVALDDASPDSTPEVLAGFAARDPRLSWWRHPQRVGMAANWRLAFEVALAHHPEAEYFAWASDHDVWAPTWLERLVDELDRHPEAVLAYPHSVVIDGEGRPLRGSWSFDTRELEDPRARLRAATRRMRAGEMVYGLFRVAPLRRNGVFRPVLWPDRLLMVELTVEGRFRQVPEVLWFRRFAPTENARAGARRQRRALYAGRPPLIARLPWWLGHGLALARKAQRGPRSARRQGFGLAARYLALAAPLELLRPLLRVRNRVASALIDALPGLERALRTVERHGQAVGRPVKLLPGPRLHAEEAALAEHLPERLRRAGASPSQSS
jgi:glycosyltransferase involved in cell wall biosynthesis